MEQSIVIKQEPLTQDSTEGAQCILPNQNASGILFNSPCRPVPEVQLSSSPGMKTSLPVQQAVPQVNININKIYNPLHSVSQSNPVLVSKPQTAQAGTLLQVQANNNASPIATNLAPSPQPTNLQNMTLLTRPTLSSGSPSKTLSISVQRLVPITMATAGKSPGVMNVLSSTSSTSTTSMRSIAPRVIAPAPGSMQAVQQFRVIPTSTTQTQPQIAPKTVPGQVPIPQPQRVLVPAPPSSGGSQQICQAMTPTIANLPTGTAIQLPPGTVISGGIVYVPQPMQQQQMTSGNYQLNVPVLPNANIQPASSPGAPMNGSSPPDTSPTRPRKPCNCTKSQCLKLYCDCFANGEFCSGCNCNNCYNNMEHEKDRSKAIKACLERNPQAFHPKIGKGRGDHDRRHNKGCHCKRSGCLKNYCECYEAKILCTNICKCTGCKNYEESPERKTLMHLADAAVVRVQQQNAARSKLESQIEDLPSRHLSMHTGERMPFSFVTGEVAEATSNCLLEQAARAEKMGHSLGTAEQMILQEFGRCMTKIIHASSRAKER